jgi:hypothetical protein
MGIVYVVLGAVAVIVVRAAFRTFKNLKTINHGEEFIRMTIMGLGEKGHADLADIEESKLTDASFANDAYLTVVGKGYSGHHRSKENFASASAVAIFAGNSALQTSHTCGDHAAGAQSAV